MGDAGVDFSVSTWRQPVPASASAARAEVVARTVALVDALGNQRLRVAIDGLTASGKTSFGHELALGIAARGRRAARASLDDFKRPWREAHLYDRRTGEGYYRNAFDCAAARRLLLEPAGPSADGRVALCSIDPLTQVDHASVVTAMARNGVLIVDGTFACRPELDDLWDLRIWLDVDEALSVRRGTLRDAAMEGGASEAEALHRDRYLAAERIYIAEVDPLSFVEVVVDNRDFARPVMLRPSR